MSVEPNVLSIIDEHFNLLTNSTSRQTTAKDIPSWDSLNNINLLLKCEKKFNLKFSALDLVKVFTVGDFIDLIDSKKSSNS